VLDNAGAIEPRGAGFAQLVTEDPVVALSGDRFVIRDETNSRTLGGGIVLNPLGRRVRKPVETYRANLWLLKDSSGAAALEALINLQESFALGTTRIATLMNIPVAEVDAALREASRFVKLSVGDEEAFTTRTRWDDLKRFALEALATHHRSESLSPGLDMEALRTRLPYEIGARAFRPIVDRLSHESEIVREESELRLKSHRVQLGGDAETLGASIEAALTRAEFQPPDLKQLGDALKVPASQLPHLRTVLLAMERQGRVAKIATDLYFSRTAADAAKDRLVEYLATHPEITAATFRDLLGASRKFAIALLDHFDHIGVTTRVGDTRRLRTPS
jgi:selenocysteine-specific elongation factor